MKRIKNMIFHSDNEMQTEKAFKQSISVCVFGIVLCMIALCSVTWAWFSVKITSSSNTIQSAHCSVFVSVADENTAVEAVGGTYTLLKDTAYEFKITAIGTAKTAYCILNIGGNEYYTVPIPTQSPMIDGLPAENCISFILQFTADATEIKVIPRWGTYDHAEAPFRNGLFYLNLQESIPVTTDPQEDINTETTDSAESDFIEKSE